MTSRRGYNSGIGFQQGRGFPSKDLRLVLVGKTGSGKSATGNTILGEDSFKSGPCMSSVTESCEKAQGEVMGRSVTLVDTPGLFDTSLSQQKVLVEILRCLAMSAPGPHAILLVLQIGRFTEEERRSVEIIQEIFRGDAAQYTILIFTHADKLKKQSFQDFISKQDKKIQDLVDRFDRRVLPFNNENKKDYDQVTNLLKMIDCMLAQREKPYFTNEAFQKMDKALVAYQQKDYEEKKAQIESEKQCAAAKMEAEWEIFSTKMNKEKLETQLKRRTIEQKILTLCGNKEEIEQKLKVEAEKLKQLEKSENTLRQRENEYRKKIDSEIKRAETEIEKNYWEMARQAAERSSDFLNKNKWIILGTAAVLAGGIGIGAGIATITAAPPAAAGIGGLIGSFAATAAEIGPAAAAMAAEIGPAAAAMAAEMGPAAAAMAGKAVLITAAQCSIQ